MTEQPRDLTPPDHAEASPYDRTEWEAAVLARRPRSQDMLVALVLSHHAGADGVLAENGVQRLDRLRAVTRLPSDSLRMALKNLRQAGLIWRPPAGGPTHVARPITLTVPARPEEPPQPGDPS